LELTFTFAQVLKKLKSPNSPALGLPNGSEEAKAVKGQLVLERIRLSENKKMQISQTFQDFKTS